MKPDTCPPSSAENNTLSRCYGFDIIRGIAAFLVVSCHLSISTTDAATLILRYNQIAVGLFAAISGFLLSQTIDRVSTKDVIKKRFARIVPLHVIWSIIYLSAFSLSDCFLHTPVGYLQNINLVFIAKAFLRGCATVHLWFLPSLFYSSILLVFIDRLFPRKKIMYLVASAIVLFGAALLNNHLAYYDIRLLAFLLMGFGLFRILPESSLSISTKKALFLWLIAVLLYGFFYGHIHRYIIDFILILVTMIVFSDKRIPRTQVGTFFSSVSLLVYLVHVLIATLLSSFIKRFFHMPAGILLMFSTWLLVFFLSVVFSWSCNKLLKRLKESFKSFGKTEKERVSNI
jgi:peptidoglycan/LPS O-acetylase OafA/YrhL